jgi:hypothetical protein
MTTRSITAARIGKAGPEPLPAAFPMRAGGPGEGSGSCGGIDAPNETLGSLARKACSSKQFRKYVSFAPVSRGFSSPGRQPSSPYTSFLTRGKHHRPVLELAGSSHSVSITEVRIGAKTGRRCTRRRPFLSSHSDPSSTRLRRVVDMTGAGAHPSAGSAPRRRMRRKAAPTCNANRYAYSLPLWRSLP